jgi:integrase
VVVAGRAEESDPKTLSGERSLALDPTTWSALRAYVGDWTVEREQLGQDTDLLFVWPNGKPIHPDTITSLFHRHCAAAGLPRIRLHDVRHSYATAALKAGIPAKVISERLGHATAAFTLQTYTHVIPGMDESAASTVAELILGRPGGSEPTDVHGSVHAESLAVLEKQSAAAIAAADIRSGGRI